MKKSSTGKSVEYDGIIDKLIDDIIPNHFGVEVDEEARARILDVSTKYSKSAHNGVKDWVEDSEKKENMATSKIREASELFLEESYNELKSFN